MGNQETILLECEYFPCIAWYTQFLKSERILIEKFEYFERTSFRNRCIIAGPNGQLTLSVPLEGGRNQKSLMKDIKISQRDSWQIQHWKTLESCYNRSPYFEFFVDSLHPLFQKKYVYLFDLNLETLHLINKLLNVKKEFGFTESFHKQYDHKILDLRQTFKVGLPDVQTDIRYVQTFEAHNGFISGLSTLDLIFCYGKGAAELLIHS